jgi:plastocyanin
MRRCIGEFGKVGALALSATFLVTGCRAFHNIVGLAQVINDDGNYPNNPNGQNPGTHELTITAYFFTPTTTVGQNGQLMALYAGQLIGEGSVAWSSSDSSMVNFYASGSQIRLTTLSVGHVDITGTYQGAKATLGVDVLPNSAGISALLSVGTDAPVWVPSAVKLQAGSSAQFNIGSTHNVTFAAVPGAPSDIALGAAGTDVVRLFPTAGTFAYQCTIHGESGIVNVFAIP